MAFNKKLHKVSDTLSPQQSFTKQSDLPQKSKKGRVLMGGLGDSYLSYYKIQNEKQLKNLKAGLDINFNKQPIIQKSEVFQSLQQKIMEQTSKNKQRVKCFQDKLYHDYTLQDIQIFINKLITICLHISKSNTQHQKQILYIIHKFHQYPPQDKKLKSYLLLSLILNWFQPILKMMHKIVTKKNVHS